MFKNPILMALLSAILFGAATPASKMLLTGITPFQLAGLLYFGAAIAVAPSAIKSGGFGLPRREDRKNKFRLFGAILFGGILGPVTLLFGLHLAESASVSLWLNLEMAATAVLGAMFFRDHLGYRGWIGVAAAMLASVLVAWQPENSNFFACILVLLACIFWGMDNHLTALIDGITPSQSTFWKGIIAGTVNLSIGTALDPIIINIQTLIIALTVGGLSYGVSIVFYILSAQKIGAIRAQILFSSAPFFGVALSVMFIGERLSTMYLIAIPIFVCGVIFLLMEGHSHSHRHDETTHEHFHHHNDEHHTHSHPDLPTSTYHSHAHIHEQIEHYHPHWPDIHHRHQHNKHNE